MKIFYSPKNNEKNANVFHWTNHKDIPEPGVTENTGSWGYLKQKDKKKDV